MAYYDAARAKSGSPYPGRNPALRRGPGRSRAPVRDPVRVRAPGPGAHGVGRTDGAQVAAGAQRVEQHGTVRAAAGHEVQLRRGGHAGDGVVVPKQDVAAQVEFEGKV